MSYLQIAPERQTAEQLIKNYGGYSIINGLTYVISNRAHPYTRHFHPNRHTWAVITSYEYDMNGAETGLSSKNVMDIANKIARDDITEYLPVLGAYTYSDGNIKTEVGLAIHLDSAGGYQRVIQAERIRVALRQEAVILVKHNGEVVWIKEEE